jgi:hypothetical protein
MNRNGLQFTKADMKRMLEAARDAGFEVGAIEMKPDGTIRIEHSARNLEGTEANDSLKNLILREAKAHET